MCLKKGFGNPHKYEQTTQKAQEKAPEKTREKARANHKKHEKKQRQTTKKNTRKSKGSSPGKEKNLDPINANGDLLHTLAQNNLGISLRNLMWNASYVQKHSNYT